MMCADLTLFKDQIALENIDWDKVFDSWDEYDRWQQEDSEPQSESSVIEEQLLFEHLNRKCTCGSGDIWSECNGIDGTSSYCG